jgi:hypothetical protein
LLLSIKQNRSKASIAFEVWNRKLHFYLGLYFLFFLWLFSLTGLLLNHGRWAMALGANQRAETRYERSIEIPAGNTDLARARDIIRQLNLVGEVDWPASQQPGRLAFNVNRPKDANQVRVDLSEKRAFVQHFDNSHWATFRIFHTFSGSRYNAPGTERDWIVTTAWVIAMDALAAGLIVMVFGSYYMWYRLKSKRTLGVVVLTAGFVGCGMFLLGVI